MSTAVKCTYWYQMTLTPSLHTSPLSLTRSLQYIKVEKKELDQHLQSYIFHSFFFSDYIVRNAINFISGVTRVTFVWSVLNYEPIQNEIWKRYCVLVEYLTFNEKKINSEKGKI